MRVSTTIARRSLPLGAYEAAFAQAPHGMALVDVQDRVLRANRALCRTTGYSASQVRTHSFGDLADPRDRDIDDGQRAELLAGRAVMYQTEKRFRHADGHLFWVLLSVSLVRDPDSHPAHFITEVQDISERKVLEGRLEALVDHDFLTGLFNVRYFTQALANEIKSAARYGGGGAVLLLDLDHFKSVNDEFGHKAGDELLRSVADALRGRVRETDVLARLGGDEFGIIMPRVDVTHAGVLADGIVAAVASQRASQSNQHIAVTASVGVAALDGMTSIEALAAADLAMYQAKDAGRNGVALYPGTSVPPSGPSSRLAEVERIQRALTQNRLRLFCQPIRDLASNSISQYELLLRLRTEEGELLTPSSFLYVAERFGSILQIDAWVLRQAVALIATQRDEGRTLTLHVNLSAKSIGSALLLETLDSALAASKVDPERLVFELTETAAIGNIDLARVFTTELRSRGCRLALDDFGSGFGSFYYLKHLPFDYFKIDGDFVRGFGATKVDQLVIEAIVGIAKGMGKKTVAEFVTDQAMADRLHSSGIDYAQGHYIGVPLPVEQILR